MSKNKQTVAATHHTNYLIVHPLPRNNLTTQTHPPTLGDGAACEDRKELVQYSSRVSCSGATCTTTSNRGAGRVVLSYGHRRAEETNWIRV